MLTLCDRSDSVPSVDPLRPNVLPTDEEDRRAWLRYWLPGVSAKALRSIRDEVLHESFATTFGRYHLTDEAFDEVLAYYVHHEMRRAEFLPPIAGGRRRYGDPGRLRRFIDQVTRIDVQLKPGGVAVLRDPDEVREQGTPRPKHRVEITWIRTGRQGSKPVVAP